VCEWTVEKSKASSAGIESKRRSGEPDGQVAFHPGRSLGIVFRVSQRSPHNRRALLYSSACCFPSCVVECASNLLVRQLRHRHPLVPGSGTGSTWGRLEHQQSCPGVQVMGELHWEQNAYMVGAFSLVPGLRDSGSTFSVRCFYCGKKQQAFWLCEGREWPPDTDRRDNRERSRLLITF